MNAVAANAPIWKRVTSSILDFFTIFLVGGNIIAMFTGETTPGGFALQGWSALLLLAVVVSYFFVGRRVAGGTLWDRFFGVARPQAYS